MLENHRTVLVLVVVLCLAPTATCRACYTRNGSVPLNYNHDLRSGTDCLPCFYACTQCPDTQTCSLCEEGYYQEGGACKECPVNCRSCNQSGCLNCHAGHYLSGGWCRQCLEGAASCSLSSSLSCKAGYYYDSAALSCGKCIPNCRTCRTSQGCDACAAGYFYASSQAACSPCMALCSSCSQQAVCDVCVGGSFRATNGSCAAYTGCGGGCLECPNGSCTLCSKGYYAKAGTCVQGASILCRSAMGPDFGSCLSCEKEGYTPADAASYCIPRQTNATSSYVYLTAYNNPSVFGAGVKVCDNIVSPKARTFSLSLTIVPSYLMVVSTQIFSYSIAGTLDYNLTVATPRSTRSLGLSRGNLSSTETCNSFLKVVTEDRTTFSLDSDALTLSLASSSPFSVGEVLISLSRCQTPGCQACSSASLCLSCYPPYLLMKNTCVPSCDAGYYANTVSRTCVYSCPQGMYTDLANYQCLPCQSPCSSCTSASDCLSCEAASSGVAAYLEGNRCVAKCSLNTTYADAATLACVKCLSPCDTCSGSGRSCTSCLSGYLEPTTATCVAECPRGTYSDFSLPTITCRRCVGCEACVLNSTTCLSCAPPTVLHGSKCVPSCPAGYFQSPLSTCLSCDLPCRTCSNSSTNCTGCSFGNLLATPGMGVCVALCPAGSYPNENSVCAACPVGCASCKNATYCESCSNATVNGTVAIYYLADSACSTTCSSGFKDSANNMCSDCLYPCLTCEMDFLGTACKSCGGGLYLIARKCVPECPEGYFLGNQSCLACQSSCKTCSNNSTCDSCKPSVGSASAGELFVWDPQSSKCTNRSGCLEGRFVFLNISTSLYSCQPCQSSCATCFLSPSNCTSCSAPLLFFALETGGSCLSACPNGYYSASGGCQACSSNCRTCLSESDKCSSCAPPAFLLGAKCVGSCPNGTYASQAGSRCEQCSSNCARCFGKYSCSECQPVSGVSYYLYNSLCVTSCPAGTLAAGKECRECAQNCSTCSVSASNCTSCLSGLFLLASGNAKSCVARCDAKYYGDTITMSCQPCRAPCLECSGLALCDSCVPNSTPPSYLARQSCQPSCPEGTFPNGSTLVCQKCPLPCKSCTAASCLSCVPGLFWHNSTCL